MNNTTIGDQLYCLARPPSSTICTFQGYEINGNTFYMVAQDKKSTNQNSGVRFDATDDNGQKDTYYGYIEEIWELDYGPDGFRSIENKIFPTSMNKNKPRSDLRDAKQRAGKSDLHTLVDRTAETFR
jgi:hypothetical protein